MDGVPWNTGRGELPIACTLTGAAVAERIARWQAFSERFLLARTRAPGEVRLSYRAEDGVVAELHALAAAERDCCGFLTWTVEAGAAAVTLVVRGTDQALDSLGSSPSVPRDQVPGS